MRLFVKLNLEQREWITFRLHLFYSVIEGVIAGVLALNEYVFIKSLQGSSYQLGILFQFSMVIFILLIFINEFLKRIKSRRRLLRITGLITRLPLFIIVFFPHSAESYSGSSVFHYIFLAIFLIYFMANLIIYPTINLLLKSTYTHSNFGRLYSYSTSVNKIVIVISTFLYGLLLDGDNYAFTYILPAMAVLGIISIYSLSMIDYKTSPEQHRMKKLSFFHAVGNSARNMLDVLKRNIPYTHFEIGFMFYGFSFMITITVITLFFEEALHLNYSSVAFYKNGYNIISILLLPFFGRLIGKIDPRKFGILTFSSILLYILAITLTEHFPYYFDLAGVRIYYLLLVYMLFHGVFAATMSLLWFIGSAYFCPTEQADLYQSIHLSLTGVRALFAPLVGVVFYEWVGFTLTFVLAMTALIIAISVMWFSYRKDPKISNNPL